MYGKIFLKLATKKRLILNHGIYTGVKSQKELQASVSMAVAVGLHV